MLLFVHLLIVVLIFFIGCLVLFHDLKSWTSRFFFGNTTTTSLWLVFNQLTLSSHTENGLYWVRFVLAFGASSIFFFLLFVLNFPKRELVIKKSNFYYLLGWNFILFCLTQTPFVFSSIVIPKDGPPVPQPGPLIPYIGVSLIIIVGVTFALGFKRLRSSQGLERLQWWYISSGLVTSYVLILALLFIPVIAFGYSKGADYSPLFLIPTIFGAGYAIVRHRLLDIKVVTTEIFLFLLLFTSVWQILFADSVVAVITQLLVVLMLLVFGILLMRSVLNEVRQREQLQKLSKQLEEANTQLKAIDEAKTEFLSVASHQLRTPLTAIKGYVSMMLEGDFGKLESQQIEPMQTIFDSTQRLVALIADMLDLSRIESGRMEFDFVAVDLCKTVDSILTELQAKAKDRGLYLYFDQIRDCPEIKADEEKIRQALINIIDNAVKYTLKGGVTIRMHYHGNVLRIEVADTGIGVDPKEKPRLFEKFFRSEGALSVTREGTGLGIYVVKKIIEAHHGKIWFDSPGVNQGTTFYIELPVPEGPIVEERIKINSLEAF